MRKLVKPLRHGQITIPKEFRDALHLGEDDLLAIELLDGKLQIEPVKIAPRTVGSPWARELYELFAPMREEAVAKGMTEEEINQLIDEALREVRAGDE